MAKIGVVGAGSWGTALALVLEKNGHEVTMWSSRETKAEELRRLRENKDKLPGVKLPEGLEITADLEHAVKEKKLVVLGVPSVHIRSTAAKMAPFMKSGQIVVNVSKGIEEDTLDTMTDIIAEEIPCVDVAVLSGPSHAEEVSRNLPTTVVAGAKSRKTAERIQQIFMNEDFRVYTSPDMLGIEIGAALKNVIALAAGVSDGLGYGDNTKAALITRGLMEIGRLGVAMGGYQETFQGLAGMGDLIVTCASKHSRNRNAGFLIGQGYSVRAAMDEVKMVVEGVYSAKAALKLAKKYQVHMPIIEEVNAVLFDGKSCRESVRDLMVRDGKTENPLLPWED